MNYTDTGTLPRFCSKCGASLQGVYFDYGNGQRLCGLCQTYRMTPSVLPYHPPQSNYTADWLKENVRLTDELNQAKQRIAELEAQLDTIQKIVAILPSCLTLPEAPTELLQSMEEIKEFYEGKAAYVPQPEPKIVSKKVKVSKTIVRPTIPFFDDDD